MNVSRLSAILLFIVSVFTLPSALAEEWQAIGGSIGYYDYTYGRLLEKPLYGVNTFTDGSYTSGVASPVWSDRPASDQQNATLGLRFVDLALYNPLTKPLQVDVVNHTIDVSSIYVFPIGQGRSHGHAPASNLIANPDNPNTPVYPSIPYVRAPNYNPVPFVTNADGTFTASWFTPHNIRGYTRYYDFGFGGLPVSVTFAPAGVVPEPEAVWMLGIGLGALGFLARRRRARNGT